MQEQKYLINLLHTSVPISKSLGVEVAHLDESELVLSAPLANNVNPHQTVFAGSQYCVATLAAWGLLHMFMFRGKYAGSLVLANAKVKYLAPVTVDFTAHAQAKSPLDIKAELDELVNGKKVHLRQDALIYSKDQLCMKFEGKFVIIPKK